MPVNAEIAAHWGDLLGQREKHIDDMGLVATAHVHGLVLVTRNIKHLARRGVAVLDPFTASRKIIGP